jgi:long-chain acyl-CoA synthetase
MNQVNNSQYFQLNSLGEIWDLVVSQFGDIVALSDPHSQPKVELTYREVDQNIKQFAAGLQSLGIASGEKIALFSDNSPRWLIADQGIIRNGCVDAVRSSQAHREELL